MLKLVYALLVSCDLGSEHAELGIDPEEIHAALVPEFCFLVIVHKHANALLVLLAGRNGRGDRVHHLLARGVKPKRTHIVKTRLDDEEHAEFMRRMELYEMSQAEFIREAISGATIKPTIVATLVSDDLLAAIGKMTAEYGRIGNNLNQIARHLNEWRSPYPAMAKELQDAAADLAALKFEVMKKVGDAVGNVQAYKL